MMLWTRRWLDLVESEIFHDTMSDDELSTYVADPPYQPLTFESLGL